ncbi:MAG: GNAT family N-acetyltransferase [Alphaproteobacteria bacterium]|nr:GNAT family N-acetyltransferase [Alphaproteobacteria bacterium]
MHPLAVTAAVWHTFPMPLTIRSATPADLDTLTAVEGAAFAPEDRFARRNLRRMLASRSAWIGIAESGDVPAGAAILLFRKGARTARLYSIASDPGFAGQGVGAALMTACVAEAVRRGCDRLRLEVRASNTRALALYERSGFSLLKEKKAYYADGESALILERDLKARPI